MNRTGIGLLCFLLSVIPAVAESDADPLGPALDEYRLGDYEGAVREALKVARENPEHAQAWFLCGMVRYQELGDYPGAVACFDRVTRLVEEDGVEFPEMRHVYRSRGMSRFQLGEFSGAEADLRRGIELQPDSVHAHLLWYLVANRAGVDGAKVLRSFAEAHDSVEWPHPLVALYLGEARAEDAVAAAMAGEAEQRLGNLCEAHFYVAELRLLEGREDLAATHFESCVETGMQRYAEYRLAKRRLEKLAD
jgi:lipoprotein NlpI